MMLSDLVDETDFIGGLNQHIIELNWQDESDLIGALNAAQTKASDAEWQALTLWLQDISSQWQLLLPKIQQALTSDWQQDRPLPAELANLLAAKQSAQ